PRGRRGYRGVVAGVPGGRPKRTMPCEPVVSGGRPATGGHGSRWGGPLQGTGAFIVHGMRGAAVADRADPSTVDEPAPARWAWRWYWVWPALLTFGAAAWQLGIQ